MKIPFLDIETWTVNADKERLLKSIHEHTNSDNRTFEKLFVGKVEGAKFRLIRVKKFGLMDYSITAIRGRVEHDHNLTKLRLTFALTWWNAIDILTTSIFFVGFMTLAALSDQSEPRDVYLVAGIGIIVITWRILSYQKKYREDKEKFKSILDGLVYRSNVR